MAVVQNGIIENDRTLREALQAEGVVFRSDTATEVIPRLLHATQAERDIWEIAGAPAPSQAFELPVRRGH